MSIAKHVQVLCLQSSRQLLSISFRYNTWVHISLPGVYSNSWNWKPIYSVVHKHTLVLKRIVQFWRQKRKQELRACRETARYAIEPQIAQSCSCASCTVFCSRTLGNGSRLPASGYFQSRSRRKCTPRLGFRTSLRS